METSVCQGLNGRFCNSGTEPSQMQLWPGFRPTCWQFQLMLVRHECPDWADFVEKVGLRTRFWLPLGSGVAVWFGQSPVAPPCSDYLAAQLMPWPPNWRTEAAASRVFGGFGRWRRVGIRLSHHWGRAGVAG